MVDQKKLTGRHVLLMLIGFFGVMLIANVAFVTVAVRSFPGESQKKSYLQGLHYNQTLAERAVQKALGWRAEITRVENDLIEVRLFAGGNALTDLTVTGELRRPASAGSDHALAFHEISPGVYRATPALLTSGAWDIEGLAKNARGQEFDFRARVIVE